MGNFVLTNGILDRYYFGSDGYAKFTNGKPVYSSRIKGYTYSTVKSSDVLLNPDYRVTQNVYPFYFVKDHLGSNRMVADNPSTMVSYYPYGGIYYDDILFYQADDNHLYNGKEMDRMYGLDTYDHGARQYNPARITWDRMDPLAEKYYHINPYLYCAGNPISYVDPDGKEVRDGVGPYCADDRNNKALAKDLAAHNDPNSIMIVAHGVYENENSRFATSIDIQTYNPSTKEWNHNFISDGKQLDSFLSANSKTWKDYKNGKISAEDLHIVFYSCGSSAAVTEMSKDKAFKDVTFIAPDRRVLVDSDASIHVGDITKYYYKEGKWHTIKNGKEPTINGNYDGKEKPGTKNFKYEKTYWLF